MTEWLGEGEKEIPCRRVCVVFSQWLRFIVGGVLGGYIAAKLSG